MSAPSDPQSAFAPPVGDDASAPRRFGPLERTLSGMLALALIAGAGVMTLLFVFFVSLMLDPVCTDDPPSVLVATELVLSGAALGWVWSLGLSFLLVAVRARGLRRRWWSIAPALFVALSVIAVAATMGIAYDEVALPNCLDS